MGEKEGQEPEVPKEIRVTVGGIAVTEAFQMKDGRMEVRWSPVNTIPDDEMEYLARTCAMNVARTEAEAASQPDPVEYIFTREGLWGGIRCPQQVWSLYMKSKGFTEEAVYAFNKAWAKSPMKSYMAKEVFDHMVQDVKKAKPWEKS